MYLQRHLFIVVILMCLSMTCLLQQASHAQAGVLDYGITEVTTPTPTTDPDTGQVVHSFISTDTITIKGGAFPPTHPGEQVFWTVIGQGAASGVTGLPTNEFHSVDAQGISMFTFKPSDYSSFVNNRQQFWTQGRRSKNTAISFDIMITIRSQGRTDTIKLSDYPVDFNLGKLTQDERDIMRQEYVDYDIGAPERGEFFASQGSPYNNGPYAYQIGEDLKALESSIKTAYHAATITISGQTVQIPDSAALATSVGYRNPQYNKAIGSIVPNSAHTRGCALDIVPATFRVVVNGRAYFPSLHDVIYPKLREVAESVVGFAICEKGSAPLAPNDPNANHVHTDTRCHLPPGDD